MAMFARIMSKREDDQDRRSSSRMPTEGLRCDRGRVADLSKTGARILTRWPWKEGSTRPLTLVGHDATVTVKAKCVWVVKEGFFHYTVGVHFDAVSPMQTDRLAEMARVFAARMMSDGYRDLAA